MGTWGITADLQFDLYPALSEGGGSGGLTSRLQDALACWDWIVEECVKRDCDALWVVGDIFDARTSIDVAVLDSVCRAFRKASKLVPLKLLAGNHDSYLRSPDRNSLQVFRGIADVFEEPTVWSPFALLPWNDDHDKLRADAKKLAEENMASFLLAHVLVEGAVPKRKGFPLADLHPDDYELVLMGDVHKPMELANGVHYVGSPMQIDFRDAGQERGFIVLDDDTGELEFVVNEVSPRFHLITEPVDVVNNVSEGDFARVQTDDPKIAAEVAADARSEGAHVQTNVVQLDDVKPRLDVRTDQEHEEVLGHYVEHQGVDAENADALVALGLELLAEAEGES
jgi:DNA repair exonuclease SbcCD nuclease subunit